MRKSIVTVAACLLLTTFSFAQKLSADKVPANVKAKFTSLYPAVTDAKWEMENSAYEAGFNNGGTHTTVVIDAKGLLKETETAIPASALPKAASDYLAKKYAGVKLTETAKIVDASGKVTFEAEVNKKDVLFDEKGNFIK